jgi:hypothetical protein
MFQPFKINIKREGVNKDIKNDKGLLGLIKVRGGTQALKAIGRVTR